MRITTASFLIAITTTPALVYGFNPIGRPAATRASTSLEARRSMLPVLRRSDLFFPDIDSMLKEMDKMMESSLAPRFPRPSLSLLDQDIFDELKLRRPLGFEVTQDEKEYKVAVHVPEVEAKDIDLQLDSDGRVLRLKGERAHEDGGMKIQSRFEKAILLSPDVDTTKLAANMSGDTLTVFAPKIEKKTALEEAKNKKIEIKIEEPKTGLQDVTEFTDDTPKAPTRLAVETLKNEKAETEAQ